MVVVLLPLLVQLWKMERLKGTGSSYSKRLVRPR